MLTGGKSKSLQNTSTISIAEKYLPVFVFSYRMLPL